MKKMLNHWFSISSYVLYAQTLLRQKSFVIVTLTFFASHGFYQVWPMLSHRVCEELFFIPRHFCSHSIPKAPNSSCALWSFSPLFFLPAHSHITLTARELERSFTTLSSAHFLRFLPAQKLHPARKFASIKNDTHSTIGLDDFWSQLF